MLLAHTLHTLHTLPIHWACYLKKLFTRCQDILEHPVNTVAAWLQEFVWVK